MAQSVNEEIGYRFRLARQAYKAIRWRAYAMFIAFFVCAGLGISSARFLWPLYTHTFTFYLKWQDALVASSCCVALVSLGGCILVLRFLRALRHGYQDGMLILEGQNTLSGRDLSPKNFVSIFWAVATTLGCFAVMLAGLAPVVLIGLTIHLSNPVLLVFATIAAFLLSLAGLGLALPFGAFFIIGLVGGVSFCRRMGASQTYNLSKQSVLRLNGFVLAVLHPDKPESLFDLHLLTSEDQSRLLQLLHERWRVAERTWNPGLGEEIEAALRRSREDSTLLNL